MDFQAIWDTVKGWFAELEITKFAVAYVVMMIPVAFSFIYDMHIHKELIGNSLRATVQLMIIAVILLPVFDAHWIVQIGLIGLMIALGASIAHERGKDIPRSYWIALLSIFLCYTPIIVIFLLTGALEWEPNIWIPISGMIIGNASRRVAQNFHKARSDFEEHQSSVEAMMIDGADSRTALKIPASVTLQNAMVPNVDSLKTLGIVHIPGAMAGMIIGGADPMSAAGYQILIFFGMVSTAALSTIIANLLTFRIIFNRLYPHLK